MVDKVLGDVVGKQYVIFHGCIIGNLSDNLFAEWSEKAIFTSIVI